MPQYRWKGINLCGEDVYGKRFARSEEKLDAFLFRHDIALLQAIPLRSWRKSQLSLADKVHFFRHLAMLIAAGVRVSDALGLIAASLHMPVQEIVLDISNAVEEGYPLSSALLYYPELLDKHLIPLVIAGEDSGRLSRGLERIAAYVESMQFLQTKLMRALMMPFISALFFLVMVGISVLAIVPRFQDLFASLGKPLPWATSVVFGMNDWLRSRHCVIMVLSLVGIVILMRSVRSQERVRLWYDWALLRMPFLGRLLYNKDCMLFLQTLGLLLEGGVHLTRALPPSIHAITNGITRQRFEKLEKEVIAGKRLSEVLAHVMESSELSELIAIGESSGTLVVMINQAAFLYQERLYRQLELLTTAIQPLILVIMGLLIALLVMVIYTPLLTLSDVLF